jgi:hypothetical protein
MIRRSFVFLFAVLVVAGMPRPAHAQDKPPARYVPFDVALWSPVSIFPFRRKVVVGASVNLLYGRAASVYGVEAGLVNRETESFGGIQIGGILNLVGDGKATGIQLAGFINSVRGRCAVIQIAFGGNYCGYSPTGVGGPPGTRAAIQLGMINRIRSGGGVQVGLINASEEVFTGLKVALFFNQDILLFKPTSDGDIVNRGIIIGGILNMNGNVRGLQLTLGGNMTNDLRGVQVGALNYAGEVRGLQIGVINYAKRVRGLQLGAINIATKNALPIMVLVNGGF